MIGQGPSRTLPTPAPAPDWADRGELDPGGPPPRPPLGPRLTRPSGQWHSWAALGRWLGEEWRPRGRHGGRAWPWRTGRRRRENIRLGEGEGRGPGSAEGRARAAGREGPPEEHSRVIQGANQQVWVEVPVHVQTARQGVAKALHAHSLAFQHLRDQTVSPPAVIPTFCHWASFPHPNPSAHLRRFGDNPQTAPMVDKDLPVPIKGSPHSKVCRRGKKQSDLRKGWGGARSRPQPSCSQPAPSLFSILLRGY